MAPEPSITPPQKPNLSRSHLYLSGRSRRLHLQRKQQWRNFRPERKDLRRLKKNDFSEAVDCFSRALEIRLGFTFHCPFLGLHHGELAPECANAYYQYGRALLESKQNDDKDVACKNVLNGESSTTLLLVMLEKAGVLIIQKVQLMMVRSDDDPAEADEEESDLDLAWKMLDVARAIAEKNPGDTMEKVDILSTLAEVALEREDIETSLNDYQKSLSILERLVEPDSRHLAELNFRICLCLEIGSKPQEAIPYCQKAISVCKALLQRLINEVKSSGESTTTPAISELEEGDEVKSSGESATTPAITELDEGVHQLSNMQADKEAEIETLTGLSGELEKKLEDLQQLVLNPKSILSEILGMVAAKGKGGEKSAFPTAMSSSQMGTATSSGGFDSPTISTAHTNGVSGVTDLGVVGRGVKRVLTSTGSMGSSTVKKPTPDPSSDKGDGKTI
ncbi:NASP-related protein [Salix suchowensis]|nr:NASP-related protein [Salix suchowensis]